MILFLSQLKKGFQSPYSTKSSVCMKHINFHYNRKVETGFQLAHMHPQVSDCGTMGGRAST